MTIARLASGLGVIVCFAACARSAEPSAPSASATSASPTVPGAPAEAKPESAAVPAPAPLPAGGPQGLDQPKSKAADDEAEFADLEAAERALNQAKADLDRLALAEPAPSVGRNATADRAAEKKDAKSAARAPGAAGAAAPTKSNALCEDACRAFSSLTRAANAVCRLDGSSGAHCTRAKHVLADAQQRVASCSCPSASD
ncbi:MAG TPA: hypothetical protein VHM25_01515 [Polyangiaceae bacterium]|nr:hypothetical protein [Polyangiaceae bacterium]